MLFKVRFSTLFGLTIIKTSVLSIGDFSKATVLLNGNRITRFEASVFRDMLRSMTNGTGIVNINRSKKPSLTVLLRHNAVYKLI